MADKKIDQETNIITNPSFGIGHTYLPVSAVGQDGKIDLHYIRPFKGNSITNGDLDGDFTYTQVHNLDTNYPLSYIIDNNGYQIDGAQVPRKAISSNQIKYYFGASITGTWAVIAVRLI